MHNTKVHLVSSWFRDRGEEKVVFLLKGCLISTATLLTKLKYALLPGGTSQDVFPVMEESAMQSQNGIFCADKFLRDITCPRNVLAFSNKAFVSLCGFFAWREKGKMGTGMVKYQRAAVA